MEKALDLEEEKYENKLIKFYTDDKDFYDKNS